MKSLLEFIQRIMKDLKLDRVAPTMREALELQLGKIIDRQIDNALKSTLTDEDWEVFEEFKKTHPEAKEEEAMDAMLERRPEIKEKLEDTLMNTYNDIMLKGMAVDETIEANEQSDESTQNIP